jgi:hypothetical protein
VSCTDCGRKGGCDSRKGAMFDAIEAALARLYPTRRWSERDEVAAFGAGLAPGEGDDLAAALAGRLHAATLFRPGNPEETCDYVYVLCLGRTPSLLELGHGALDASQIAVLRAALKEGPVTEIHLRVALSTLARFAAVQEVRLEGRLGGLANDELSLVETPRAGVFDPALLRRLRTLVSVLGERGIRNLDFGEIVEPPAGFDPGDYADLWGGVPGIANYLFFPQPPSTVASLVLGAGSLT